MPKLIQPGLVPHRTTHEPGGTDIIKQINSLRKYPVSSFATEVSDANTYSTTSTTAVKLVSYSITSKKVRRVKLTASVPTIAAAEYVEVRYWDGSTETVINSWYNMASSPQIYQTDYFWCDVGEIRIYAWDFNGYGVSVSNIYIYAADPTLEYTTTVTTEIAVIIGNANDYGYLLTTSTSKYGKITIVAASIQTVKMTSDTLRIIAINCDIFVLISGWA
jgi:hypothetical protein